MKITQRGGDGEMHMDELKSQKVWLCWNYETRKGKRTKVPISASGTATGTNSEYAHTWVTYDEAIKAADKHGYNGVGFRKGTSFWISTTRNSPTHLCT